MGLLRVPQISAELYSGGVQQTTQLRFAVCSKLRACQMISGWLAANCPLPGCDTPVCDIACPQGISLSLLGCFWLPQSIESLTMCCTREVLHTKGYRQSASPLPCPYKEDCIMKLCAVRRIWFKIPFPWKDQRAGLMREILSEPWIQQKRKKICCTCTKYR